MAREIAGAYARQPRRFQGRCFSCLRRWRLAAWLAIVTLVAADAPLPVLRPNAPPAAVAEVQAARILTIAPSCAGPGDVVQITGRGFGAENVQIFVDTLSAFVLSAYGNYVTFIVPADVPGGVTTVCDTQPGQHQGCITFRVQQGEICGNQIDEDCDGEVDDADACAQVNHAPAADAGLAQTAPVGATVQFDGNGSSDPDGDALSFQWELLSQPGTSSTVLQDATTATPTLLLDATGSYAVQLTVSDGSLTDTDTVVVSTSNSAPVADAGPDQSGRVGDTLTLDGSRSVDIDGNLLTYQWSLAQRPVGGTAALSNATSVTPQLTLDVFGDYVVQLIVHDGTTSSQPDTVTLSTINSSPVADAGPDQSHPVTTLVTLDGSRSTDVDGNPLTYEWSLASLPAGSTATLSDPTSVMPTFTIDLSGQYVARLIVHDGLGSSQPDTVTISTVNSPPVADAGPDQSRPVTTVVTLDGGGSHDVNGDALTLQWSFVSRPAGGTATLSDPTSVTPTFTLDLPGTYVAQLIVHDGSVSSPPDTVTISTVNSPPVAEAGTDQSHPVNTLVTLDGSGSHDVDGNALLFVWAFTHVPAGSTATLSDPTAVRPTFTIDLPGQYVAQLIVQDDSVSSQPDTVLITTENAPPVAEAGPAQTGVVGTTVTLDGAGSQDVDGDTLTYQWSLLSQPAGSTATLTNSTSIHPTLTLDAAGSYLVQLIVHDGTVDSPPDTVIMSTNNSPPVADAGPEQAVLTGAQVQLNGSGSQDVDGDPLTYQWALIALPTGSTAVVTNAQSITPTFMPDLPGDYVAQLIVHDGTVDSAPDAVLIVATAPDTTPPPAPDMGKITTSPVSNGQTTVTGTAGSVEGDSSVTLINTRTQESVTVTANADGSFTVTIGAQAGDELTVVATDSAGNTSVASTAYVVPPDPSLVAPPVDLTVATTVYDATAFLYTGANPIQTGVAPGTIAAQRAAVVRGRVLRTDNTPLPGVTITVLDHPELGQTLSRADGVFDLAVNGGGLLTVTYAKDGYLPAQRQIAAPWQEYAWLPDVALLQPDPQVTMIDLTSPVPMQVAAGSMVTDADGARQALVMIPQGTTAEMVLSDGSTQPLTTLDMRLTEYTVGTNGPKAMPGELPPTSGYTYAVEVSVDDAFTANAEQVTFSQPLPVYVENFLQMPVGTAVPTGVYDQQQGTWLPTANGVVLEIVSVSGGVAELDTNGDSVADDAATLAAAGVTAAEQQQLAQLYPSGTQVWRFLTTRTGGLDTNWPFLAPSDASGPTGPAPGPGTSDEDAVTHLDEPDVSSDIAFQNQTLGQQVALVGAPFTLHYQSDRVRGRTAAYQATIPLSGATIPASLKRIEATFTIAGQQIKQTFPPQTHLTAIFTWDGKDGYGRVLQGRQPLRVTIDYWYDVAYASAAPTDPTFGESSGAPLSQTILGRGEFFLGEAWETTLGGWDAQALGVGGWSLDVQHGYDVIGRTLYFGDGTQRGGDDTHSAPLGVGIGTFAGDGGNTNRGDGGLATSASIISPRAVVVAADGTVYIADDGGQRVRQVDPAGVITTVAGGGSNLADGIPATSASLGAARGLARDAQGNLYIASATLHTVRKVDTAGIITTVAGTGAAGFSGDGGLATSAQLSAPWGVTVDGQGNLYIADTGNHRVRKVSPTGVITTVVGNGTTTAPTDGQAATTAGVSSPRDLTMAADGALYLSDAGHRVIWQVRPDGRIFRFAGTVGQSGSAGDGGPATSARLAFTAGGMGLAVDGAGNLYIGDATNHRVRQVGTDGIIATIVGTGVAGFTGDRGPALATQLNFPQGLAVGADDALYFADTLNRRVRRLRSVLPGFAGLGDIVLPSQDGSEAYVMSPAGKHLRTVNTLTNSVIYEFGYDGQGRLITITNTNNNVTTITRDMNGQVTSITGPYGQHNTITLDSNGYLASITNPNGETTSFSYTANGLLTSVTPPGQPASTFTYGGDGRLQSGQYPDGGSDTLVRGGLPTGYQVQHTTAEGTQTTYQVEYLPDGRQQRTTLLPDGTVQRTILNPDGSQTVTQADGMTQSVSVAGDPRFGLQTPTPTNLTVDTPGGLSGLLTNNRTATLSDPSNPLSLTSQTDTVNFNGRTATRTYDAVTRTATDTSPAGRIRTTTLDSQGRVTQQQQGTLTATQFSYDSQGRLASRSQGTRTSTLSYDTLGRLQTLTDPANRTVQFQYDAAGRVTQQTLPDSRVIAYSYDANGNVTSITPPGRPAHAFTYTAANLEESYLPPQPQPPLADPRTVYAYNADRQVTSMLRPDGQQVQLGYDSAGRLSTQTFPDPQTAAPTTVTYSYAPTTGNLASVATSSGQMVAYTYDGSLLTQSQWTGPIGGSVSWTYDNNYRKTSQSVNGGDTVAFTYDADDLLTGAGAMTLTWDSANGLLTGTALGNVTDTTTYSGFGEVATYQASVGGTAVLSAQYTRDSLGRITQKVETIGGVTTTYGYTYDTAGRLMQVTQNGVTTAMYTYDANSNRLTGPTGATTYTYDDQDRLLTRSSALSLQSFAYTPNGELLTKTAGAQETAYAYDALGNLLHVELPDGTQIDYLVEGENRRIGKQVNGIFVQGFLYENQLEPVAELDGSGNLVSRFVYCGCGAGNIPQYMLKNGVTYRIIADHLGSPRLVVNTTDGTIVQRMDYDEFGNVILDTNPGFQPFGFAGGIYDRDTGLVRHGARDYDPETGRWTDKDSLRFRGLDTNLYGYVFSDPVNVTDPSGKALGGLVDFAGQQGIVGVLTSISTSISSQIIRDLFCERLINWSIAIRNAVKLTNLVPAVLYGAWARVQGLQFLGQLLLAPVAGLNFGVNGELIDIGIDELNQKLTEEPGACG